MLLRRRMAFAYIFLLLSWPTGGVPAGAQELPSLKSSVSEASSHDWWKGLGDGPGFSFTYGEQNVDTSLPDGWTAKSTSPQRLMITASDGLEIASESTSYPQYRSVEYTLRFRNTGTGDLAPLTDLFSVDLTFDISGLGEPVVHSVAGGTTEKYYPAKAYTVSHRLLYRSSVYPLVLETAGGRSSDGDAPFLFLNGEKGGGLYIAMGWSGQWRLTVRRAGNRLRVHGGVSGLDLSLRPGEQVTTPRILVGFYDGDLAAGSNQLRRLIRNHYTPQLAGKLPLPLSAYDHYWAGAESKNDETSAMQRAAVAGELGLEYFILEPGWFDDHGDPRWWEYLGNWDQESRARFPSGIRALADYVRSQGVQFALWITPEQAGKASILARQHPEWIAWSPPPEALDHPYWTVDPWPPGGTNWGLVDFGKSEVRAWAKNLLDRKIREYGVKYLKWDFNMNPLDYWNYIDSQQPHRAGISQIRHVEGLYEVWDWIRKQHPELVLEICASGGRRIDLETIRRAHVFALSDENHPHNVRHHWRGAHYFLPGNYLFGIFAPRPPSAGSRLPDLDFQNFFGSAFGLGGMLETWPDSMKEQMKQHLAVYKSLRRFLVKDYYALFEQPRSLDGWDGAQFHDPGNDQGFLIVFRLSSVDPAATVRLGGLQEGAEYEFSDPYHGTGFTHPGGQELTIRLDPNQTKVLEYKRKN